MESHSATPPVSAPEGAGPPAQVSQAGGRRDRLPGQPEYRQQGEALRGAELRAGLCEQWEHCEPPP